jgi:hypothetical protein
MSTNNFKIGQVYNTEEGYIEITSVEDEWVINKNLSNEEQILFRSELETEILKDLTKLIEEDEMEEKKLAIKAAKAPFYVCWTERAPTQLEIKNDTLDQAKIEAEGILKNASGIEEVFIMKKYLTAKRSKPTFTKSGV